MSRRSLRRVLPRPPRDATLVVRRQRADLLRETLLEQLRERHRMGNGGGADQSLGGEIAAEFDERQWIALRVGDDAVANVAIEALPRAGQEQGVRVVLRKATDLEHR